MKRRIKININSIVAEVSRLKPGEYITYERFILTLMHDEPRSAFGTVTLESKLATELQDRVRERIVGSAYDIIAFENPVTGNLTFERLKEPLDDGRLCYCAPDKRHLYYKVGNLWYRNEEAIKEHCRQRDKNHANTLHNRMDGSRPKI